MARKLLELDLHAVEFRTSLSATFGDNSTGVPRSTGSIDEHNKFRPPVNLC
jgi:hypothetical protein